MGDCLTENTQRVYHVTHTRLVPRISRQGLRLAQTSNWLNGKRERLGGGAIHVFESHQDAILWAAKMGWTFYQDSGSPQISILHLDHAGPWDDDYNDPLSQLGCEGKWLKAFRAIPPTAIVLVECLCVTLVREALAAARIKEVTDAR